MLFEKLLPENGYVIGEIACGHEGSLKKLIQLINCVADGDAQIVKFQLFEPEEMVTREHPEWAIYERLALKENSWREAVQHARSRNLVIFTDVFGSNSFELARKLGVDGYKIHSSDLLNSFFIARVAADKKVLMIGVGGAHRIEIYNLLNFLKERGSLHHILLATGVQTFPTPLEAHSLEEVADLTNKYGHYGIKVAFADHVSGDLEEARILPLMALAKGACVIEKHVTIDRNEKWEDYQSALSAEDFKKFVGQVKRLAPLLSKIGPFNSFESQYRRSFKKSAILTRDKKKEYLLGPDDFKYVKHPECSIPLAGLNIVGQKLGKDLKSPQVIRSAYFQNGVGGIIVARCFSNRLPSKALRKIFGRETIALLIERIKRCKRLDYVILATSTDPSDDILEEIAKREGILSFRGSLENLSLRFYEAAKHYGADHVVRITGDDILRDELMIDRAVESHLEQSCDVTFMDPMPYGAASEVFTLNTLETILKTVNVPRNTEYLTWYLQNDRYFSVNTIDSGYTFDPSLRLTLDYKEDLEFFMHIFENFYPTKPNFTLLEVLQWIETHPEIVAINKFKTAKYTPKDLDVTLNI